MCHQAQGIVAGQVTVLVVVGFEVVDIQHQHAQRLAVVGAAGAFALVHMLQPAAVETAGQGVDIGVLFAVEDALVALPDALAEQLQQVLHQLWRLAEQGQQGFAVQAQHHRGGGGDYIGRGRLVVDAADFAGAFARFEGAGRLIVEGAEVDLQLAFQQQVEVLVALEGRQEDFSGLQFAGAKALEQLAEVAGGDVLEQSHVHDVLQVGLPLAGFHRQKTRCR